MGFHRDLESIEYPTGDELTAAMNGIGMRFVGDSDHSVHIEKTLVAASIEGALRRDYRVLSVMTTWTGVHHDYINVELLLRLVKPKLEGDLALYWNAIGFWMVAEGDLRFRKYLNLYTGPRKEFGRGNSWYILKTKGEDPRFAGSPLILVPGGLRHRLRDVQTPEELCQWHAGYRSRVRHGPGFRADMLTALEAEPELTATKLARKTLGSYLTAWKAKRDFGILRARPVLNG